MKKKFQDRILTYIKKLSHRIWRQCNCSQFLWNRFSLNPVSWSLNFFFHRKNLRLQPQFCVRSSFRIWKKYGLDWSGEVEIGIFWKRNGYDSQKYIQNLPQKSLEPRFHSVLTKLTENLKNCKKNCHFTFFGRFITIFHQNLSKSIFLYFVVDYEVIYWKIKFLHSLQS